MWYAPWVTVRELVKYLSELPPESEVAYIWDGCVRTGVRFLWQAGDEVVLAGEDEVVYDDEDRPASARGGDPYWRTPRDGSGLLS